MSLPPLDAERTGDRLPGPLRVAVRCIDAVSEWTGRFTAWLIVPLILVIAYEIFVRYAFNAPTIWAFELQFMLYASTVMLGAAYTLLYGEHIRTDIFYQRWSVRWQGIVDATLYLLFYFPGIAFFLWAGWDFAYRSWVIGELSEFSPWRPPVYPLKMAIPLTAALLFLQGISEFIKSLYAAITGRRYES
ncbi:MAG: TRAP transporter small permease subunit [Candidatus Rokubacteria bacterium]|nr:TRAP transporter small permease subunit [Candidatus Rokubacteria bacterium]MBI2554502.1 TRAP transporter small permease subunit [Candidatus Rokubacteria bacterium]